MALKVICPVPDSIALVLGKRGMRTMEEETGVDERRVPREEVQDLDNRPPGGPDERHFVRERQEVIIDLVQS